jgi:hypothetical protein
MRYEGRRSADFFKDPKSFALGDIVTNLAMTGDGDLRIQPGEVRSRGERNFKPFAARVLPSAQKTGAYSPTGEHAPLLVWSRPRRGVQRRPRRSRTVVVKARVVKHSLKTTPQLPTARRRFKGRWSCRHVRRHRRERKSESISPSDVRTSASLSSYCGSRRCRRDDGFARIQP